ncbi:MAG: LysM peptidoglycan-binding domain-containing protein [Streptococcaceae bacterium]|jgi:surface antigen/LysM repeat protein|nr:LysM peptidoglycan-binding domain-containing protein [Streptococcaceae bacterium]
MKKRTIQSRYKKKQLLKKSFLYSAVFGFMSQAGIWVAKANTIIIQPGDTLWKISQENDISVEDLMRINQIENPRTLYVGQEIKLVDQIELPEIWHGYNFYEQEFADIKQATIVEEILNHLEIVKHYPDTQMIDVEYEVVSGDSVYSIANAYEVSIEQIEEWNNLDNIHLIFPSQVLKVGEREEKIAQGQDLAFINYLYDALFGIHLGSTYQEVSERYEHVSYQDANPGDFLFWENEGELTGISVYLGQEKYFYVENEIKEIREITPENTPSFATLLPTDLILMPRVVDIPGVSIEFDGTAQTFINAIGPTAQALGQKHNLYASVMIAQAMLESGSGASSLSRSPNYNIFGIKGSFEGEAINLPTLEQDENGQSFQIDAYFRRYPNHLASMMDYVSLIRTPFYSGAWRENAPSFMDATNYLQGRYATDVNYANLLNQLIIKHDLTRFDTSEIQFAGTIDQLPVAWQNLITLPMFDGINRNTSGSYPFGQCTYYVYNRVQQFGRSFTDFMGNGGYWELAARTLGFVVSNQPTVGDAVSFAPGVAGADPLFGHVAFVEAVTPNGILISEMNVVGLGIVSYRVIPASIAFGAGVVYITPR